MTTHDTHEDAWAWPCPYCGTSNAIESAVCVGCRAQLRDPEEDDLFTTVATDNAQMVDPDAPRVREVLWSTEALPEDVVAEEVADPDPFPGGAQPGTMPPHAPPAPPVGAGPFSASAAPSRHASEGPSTFATDHPGAHRDDRARDDRAFPADRAAAAATPFGPRPAPNGGTFAAAAGGVTGAGHPPGGEAGFDQGWGAAQAQPGPEQTHGAPGGGSQGVPGAQSDQDQPVTPDENGLSVAVSQMHPSDRERCAVPIGVCGALLGEQEVVLGVLAGQLMGHASVLVVTSSRVLVANARRWKPLLDQFIPAVDLNVHLRHDRDVASLTIVQGPRLTTLDGITDVAGAVELAERIRKLAERAGLG